MCKPTTFRINFKDKYGYIDESRQSDYYDISHIDYLVATIEYYGIEQIHNVSFYFDLTNDKTGIVYKVINNDGQYVFAPFYDFMMKSSIKDRYLNMIKESLFTTIRGYSSDICDTFINKIDESIEIQYHD